ncbi:carbohydrate esterase family 4 protein [Cylindrobasidium torrendii FP15055 ss-10]|uniref:Carbohydrate esterase family 4 protein n=1 Tax=Cylindrobasidium torrendii FP15055 ss-10 TaxID=1314674 RepID=A0A0D7BGZ5_9AGAR|nr:carbohydrate esterase family 4 protein [Cylindrobasidium torrendii FP15055 ss-10]
MFTSTLLTLALAAISASAAPSSLTRRAQPSIFYGCTKPNTAAITFDDGVGSYTYDVVNTLNEKGAKGTFFLNGNNWRCIYDEDSKDKVNYIYKNDHQIASHTWSHARLSDLSFDQLHDEMWRVEQALQRIVGVTPAFLRPPYGAINDQVLDVAYSRGQNVVIWDFDSRDSVGASADESKAEYDTVANQHPDTIMALNHEVYDSTAHDVLPYAIDRLQGAGYQLVTVAECLGIDAYQNVGEPETGSWTCE